MRSSSLPAFICLIFLSLSLPPVLAQTSPTKIEVSEAEGSETPFVNDENFPLLSLDFVPLSEVGVPILDLSADNISLKEDGNPVSEFELLAAVDPNHPISLMLVLDISATMENDLEAVRTAVFGLYDRLTLMDQSAVVAFTINPGGPGVDLGEPFPRLNPSREINFTNDEGALINLLNSLSVDPNSSRPLFDASVKGLRMMRVETVDEARRAVIIITDGADSGSRAVTADFATAEAATFGIPIYTIGIGPDVDADFLTALANASHGRYFPVESSNQVEHPLNQIVDQLKHSYSLRYASPTPADNERHILELGVENEQGSTAVALEFMAYYSETPAVKQLWATPLRQEREPFAALSTIQGTVTLESEVIARHDVAAVNYYVNGDHLLATTTAAPWRFVWDTKNLAPNQTHQLTLEMIDHSQPPIVSRRDFSIFVEACTIPCQFRELTGLDSTYLMPVGIALLLLFLFLVWRLWPTSPASQPVRAAARRAAPNRLRKEPQADTSPPLYKKIRSDAPAPKTRLLPQADPYSFAYLLHRGDAYGPLPGAKTTLGQQASSDIPLLGANIAPLHATITYRDHSYVLSVEEGAQSLLVNGREASTHLLADWDRIQIGSHILVFRQIMK